MPEENGMWCFDDLFLWVWLPTEIKSQPRVVKLNFFLELWGESYFIQLIV